MDYASAENGKRIRLSLQAEMECATDSTATNGHQRIGMTSETTERKRRTMFKKKSTNWKDVVRSQKLRRLEMARSKLVENVRKSVVQQIQLEDDLQLEQDLLVEELEQEYNHLFNELEAVDRPCPICGRELSTFRDMHHSTVQCESCVYTTPIGWEEFQERLRSTFRQHSERGCSKQAEVILLEGDLFIACEICDLLEAAL